MQPLPPQLPVLLPSVRLPRSHHPLELASLPPLLPGPVCLPMQLSLHPHSQHPTPVNPSSQPYLVLPRSELPHSGRGASDLHLAQHLLPPELVLLLSLPHLSLPVPQQHPRHLGVLY